MDCHLLSPHSVRLQVKAMMQSLVDSVLALCNVSRAVWDPAVMGTDLKKLREELNVALRLDHWLLLDVVGRDVWLGIDLLLTAEGREIGVDLWIGMLGIVVLVLRRFGTATGLFVVLGAKNAPFVVLWLADMRLALGPGRLSLVMGSQLTLCVVAHCTDCCGH